MLEEEWLKIFLATVKDLHLLFPRLIDVLYWLQKDVLYHPNTFLWSKTRCCIPCILSGFMAEQKVQMYSIYSKQKTLPLINLTVLLSFKRKKIRPPKTF